MRDEERQEVKTSGCGCVTSPPNEYTDDPHVFRLHVRENQHLNGHTSGVCRGYVQCNIVILQEDWAFDFLKFCQLNSKACPLLGVSSKAGDISMPSLAKDLDIRTDVPRYKIYHDGVLASEEGECTDIRPYWRNDFVVFYLGCSFSFEEALIQDGLEVRNVTQGTNVPMYRTNIPCAPAGRFSGSHMVVSMRPFKASDAIRAIQICTRFPQVHGAPIHFGDPSLIGIEDISKPDFGDPVTINQHEVPVFWACGVTPQVAIEHAKPPICITHSPGCMLVTVIRNASLSLL